MLIRHPDSARGNDLYEKPEVATLALLRAEALPRTNWEPACGPGAIVRVLRDGFSKPTPNDAPRRLGRKPRFKSDGVRLVRLGARLTPQERRDLRRVGIVALDTETRDEGLPTLKRQEGDKHG